VGKLIPPTGRARAEVRTWEALADGLLDASIGARMEAVWGGRTDGQRSQAWISRQMSRVDSARIASIKAQNAGLQLAGSAVASDAFFPFRDGIDAAAAAGITAVIQPGGSMRDAEVIAAADEHGMAMVFTGVRHFRH